MKIKFMQKALELAQKAAEEDEVPIGAVIVDPQTDEIIAEAYNQSEHVLDATEHAEIAVIRRACAKLKQNRLRNLELYVTLEPCTMCAGAISLSRIAKVYFGAYDLKGGAITNGVKFFEAKTCHHRPEVEGGILEAECAEILKNFFRNKRHSQKP